MTGVDGPAVCPNCLGPDLRQLGSRTSTHDRGAYGHWTTTTARYDCPACGAVTTLTVRVPPT